MDKQKQFVEVNEMAKEIDKYYPNAKITNSHLAEYIYNAGYRKIPEGSVVLTAGEIASYEQGLRENWEKDMANIRKETAEKIADWLDDEKGYCGLGYLVKQKFCTEEKEK